MPFSVFPLAGPPSRTMSMVFGLPDASALYVACPSSTLLLRYRAILSLPNSQCPPLGWSFGDPAFSTTQVPGNPDGGFFGFGFSAATSRATARTASVVLMASSGFGESPQDGEPQACLGALSGRLSHPAISSSPNSSSCHKAI